MIKFENVTKIYKDGEKPALDNVSFEIDRGEFVFIVGHTGSGKSTITRLLLRSQRANQGIIQVAGKTLNTLTNWRVPSYRQQVGMVFQEFNLLENKTAYENIAFALQVIGKPRHSIKTLVPEALKIVGLSDKGDRFPHQLSGGEKQRVAIARAFVNKPLVLIADEPTGSLDPGTSDEIMKVFDMISKTGTTIIMVTHDDKLVNRYKKRVLELSHGKLVRDEKEGGYKPVQAQAQAPTEVLVNNQRVKAPLKPKTTNNQIANQRPDNKTDNKTEQDFLPTQKYSRSELSNALISDAEAIQKDDQTIAIKKQPRQISSIFEKQNTDEAYENYFNDSNDSIFETGSLDVSNIRQNNIPKDNPTEKRDKN